MNLNYMINEAKEMQSRESQQQGQDIIRGKFR